MRKDGRFESKGVDPVSGRRKSFYSSTSQADADAKAGKSFGFQSPGEPTLYEFYVGAYLPTVQHRSLNWREQIAWAMDSHVLPYLAERRLSDLDRALLQQWANAVVCRISPNSARKVKIVLSGVMRLAEADGLIVRNPLAMVKLPTGSDPDKRALTPAQLRSLLEASDDRSRPVVILGGFCGLRIGEICGLRRRDVKDGALEVRGQVLQVKGGAAWVASLKTPQSRRTIPLPKELQDQLLKAAGVAFVLPNAKGGFVMPNNAHRDLDEAIAKAGIPRVTPHELRHTFVSLLENDLGAPAPVVEELAGKSKRGRLADYSHARAAVRLRWMQALWDLVSTASDDTADDKIRRIESI